MVIFKDSSLMGTFSITPLDPPQQNTMIHMISSLAPQSHNTYNPWVVPHSSVISSLGESMPLSPIEDAYNAIQSTSNTLNSIDQDLVASNPYSLPSWLNSLPPSFYYLFETFPSNESIMVIKCLGELPWEYYHHRSYFLPNLDLEDHDAKSIISNDDSQSLEFPIFHQGSVFEGNLGMITPTITIDISVKYGVMEHIHIGQTLSPKEIEAYTTLFKEFHDVFGWKYEEMPRIDPPIIVHEIKTYLGVNPFHQKH